MTDDIKQTVFENLILDEHGSDKIKNCRISKFNIEQIQFLICLLCCKSKHDYNTATETKLSIYSFYIDIFFV